jgi:phytoene synthase
MEALLAESRRIIARGSKSFALAARLFDRQTRERALLLYAWCRHCDDVIDGQTLGSAPEQPERAVQAARLQTLYDQTRSALAGDPQQEPAFQCFQLVARQCDIEARFPLELLDGFAMDVEGARYRQLEDTLRYCYHVAGTVGAMMARIMGVNDQATVLRGIHLGIGLQLSNIARDVLDDATLGRVYLPEAWLEAEQVEPTPAGVRAGRERVVRVTHRLLDEAQPYYASARQGIDQLPFRSAWAVETAARVYGEIGSVVRARGAAAWATRARVSTGRKFWLLAAAGAGVARARGGRLGDQAPVDLPALWDPMAADSARYASKR